MNSTDGPDRKGHEEGVGIYVKNHLNSCIYVKIFGIYVKNDLNSCITNIAVLKLNSNTIEQIWVNLRTPKESILLGCINRRK
jgi:hypothetical protein